MQEKKGKSNCTRKIMVMTNDRETRSQKEYSKSALARLLCILFSNGFAGQSDGHTPEKTWTSTRPKLLTTKQTQQQTQKRRTITRTRKDAQGAKGTGTVVMTKGVGKPKAKENDCKTEAGINEVKDGMATEN